MDLINTSGTSTSTNTAIAVPLDLITMTSRDIADLVEKRHDNVKRTIETLFERKVIRNPQIEFSEEINNLGFTVKREVYIFTGEQGKRDSIVVVAQLSPEFTAKLVDRWQELESQVAIQKPIQISPYKIATDQLECELKAASLFGCPLHLAQIESVKQVHKITGIDFSHHLLTAPAQQNILPEQEMLEPKDLEIRLGLGTTGKTVNNFLENIGLQTKANKNWEPTEKGKSYAQRHSWTKGTKSGYNYKWNYSVVKALYEAFISTK
jgi:phage regulator Rha-like protein